MTTAAPSRPARILYLEDDLRDVEPVKHKLAQTGIAFELSVAQTREEFELAIENTRFDLILADYRLPSYDGMTAMARAKVLQPDVPFVLISGVLGEEQAVDCVLRGATDYVLKQHLDRLVPGTQRALREAEEHRRRREAEDALRASENRMRTIFNHATDAIFIHDLDGAVIDVNDKVVSLYRVTRERALGFRIAEDFSAPQNPLHELHEHWAAVVAGNPRTFEWKTRRPDDGSTFDVEVSLARITLEDGQAAILASVRDITERKRATEEHLRRLQEEYAREAAEKSVDELRKERDLRELFVSSLTHDVRSALHAAKLGAELIRRQAGDPKISEKMSAKIISAVDRADHMIRSVLDVNRIRAGEKLAIEPILCDLRSVVTSSLEELRAVHGNRFVLDGAAVEGRWDALALGRVVENLCTNAVKYGAPNRPITVSLARSGNRVRLSVHNEGEPLAPEQLANIFVPFRRASSGSGWGIGLAVVKGLVEAHGGTVFAESAAGKGTTFIVELPLEPPA